MKKLQKEETLTAKQSKNIKAIKFPIILSHEERNKFDQWIRLGKEFYNILNNQRRLVEKWNLTKYYEANPDKLAEKQKKEDAYQAKVKAEVDSGKRLPKRKFDSPFYSPIQIRHEELKDLPIDVLSHCYGASTFEELMALDGKEIKNNKQGVPQIYLSYVDQSRYGTKLRNIYPEFNIMPSSYWLGICHQVDKAFTDFRKNKAKSIYRLPSFKKRDDDFSLIGKSGGDNNIKVKPLVLNGKRYARITGLSSSYFPNGIKIRMFKPINGKIILTSIKKEGNDYFLSITFEEQKVHWPYKHESVGVDLGVVRNIQLSNGEYKQLPIDKIKSLEEKQKRMQRKLSKKKERSKNYLKYNAKIARISEKIANTRKYHVSMFATEIARDYNIIAIENLKVKNMTKSASGDIDEPGKNVAQKSGLNKSILRVAPYMIRMKLEAKAKEYGRTVVAVDPKYTSQECSRCHHTDKKNREDQSTFVCKSCGFEINADLNAALNIHTRGLDSINIKDGT